MSGIDERLNEPYVVPAREERGGEPAPSSRRSSPRWWAVLCGFVGHHLATVTPSAGVVWLVLFRNSHGGKARMSVEQIASITGLSSRHAIRALNALVEAGLVRRVSRGCRNSGPTLYSLLCTGAIGDTGVTFTPAEAGSKHDARVTLIHDARVTLSKRERETPPAACAAASISPRIEREIRGSRREAASEPDGTVDGRRGRSSP